MKRFFNFAVTIAIALFCCILDSCKQQKELTPSVDFAPYISAFTGGMISRQAAIVVELMEEAPEKVWKGETKDKLFTFSPSLKGVVAWNDANTVTFTPESGELKPGTVYNATFALAKVMKVDKKYANFGFSFRVEDRTFNISTNPIDIQDDNTIAVTGQLVFDEKTKVDLVRKMVEVSYGNAKLPVEVEETDDVHNYRFAVKGIKRNDADGQVLITVNGAADGFNQKETRSVKIPAKDKFKLYDYQVSSSPDNVIRLTFSDRVSESQNLKSMITMRNVSTYSTQVQGNQVLVFFTPASRTAEVSIKIDKGLKNKAGESLEEVQEFRFSMEKLKPKVEILTSGTVMPNSEKLMLPFRAVALRAVDLKIIRIFENNVLMFLQENKLSRDDSSNGLRRAGRLVYKNTLCLDTDSSKNMEVWENYSLDLTGLIKQQPGAIYRIELSFKKDYAYFDCDDDSYSEKTLSQAVPLKNMNLQENAITDADEEFWDTPNTYYYDGYDLNIDWEIYDWSERENPCHPTYYMQNSRKASTNVLASDLGLIAKSNVNNTVWVAVTNIKDTNPVSDAKVTAFNYQLQPVGSGVTDESGFTVMQLKNKPYILVAESGNQKIYLRMGDGDENMMSRFDVGGVEMKKGLKGFIYGERGVWRPGDTLHVAFILEDREKLIPANHPVSFELYNPQGQFYKKIISTNGLNGFYTFHLPTNQDDPTGLWNAYIKVGGATFHKALRIETVKPNRLKINLDLPDRLDASKGTVSVGIHSQWLTGATARGLSAKMELILSKVSTQFKGYEKFIFNDPASAFTSNTTEVFDGKLNDNGDVTFNMQVPSAENAPGMLSANVTCRVFEPGGDASVFSQSVPFSPYPAYIGINFNQKKDQYYLLTDQDNVFDVVTLGPDGKPVNRSNLEYKIYRIGWSWWWEQYHETFDSYINNTSYKPQFTGKLNTVDGKGQITLRINYPDWGRYLVYVKDATGGHATGGTVLIDWPSTRGRSNKGDPNGIKMLTFSLDKNEYEVGEEAFVTIPATASDARALVALENGSEVLQREWIKLSAGNDTKYSLKITDRMAPNVYVHISLLQPHASTADLPIRMYGVLPLFVTNKASVLAPVITMMDVLKPETDFEVKVKEQNGKPMTYTLAIVDDGLLDLTNFKTPNPWSEFYAREALGIRTWDMFDDVMGAYAGKFGSLFSIGGDGDLNNGSKKANRFKPVVLYVGPVALKAGEEKKHALRLPPYIGSVRVMVVAGQNGAYGQTDKTLPVRTPLMLLSSLPRVLSVGEKISLPVNVFAMEDNVKDVIVTVETTGKLKASDGNSKSVNFTATGDKIVYFPMQTGAETGIEKVTITATNGSNTSKETIEIDIRNPNPPVIKFENKLLEKGQSATFNYTLDGGYEGNWIKVEMSRIPAVDISRRNSYLYDYRHFCSEQLTSRALPLLFMNELVNLTEKEAEMNKQNITEAINHLYGRQLPNGGICYWAGDGTVNDWISSYAGSFLVFAKERGYQVNSNVITKWISYQRSIAQQWRNENNSSRYTYNQSDFLQAYRLYSLALAGAPELGAMNRLKEVKTLSQQAKWRLAAAYALCGKQDAANELVFNASTTVTPYSSNNPTYGSFERDEAMILEALIYMGKNEDAFKQAQKVSKNLTGERYFNTQSTAFSIAAMGQFAAKTSGKLDVEWSVNGKAQPKVDSRKAVFQQQLPTNPLSGNVKVENKGDGQLYFSMATRTCPLIDELPAEAENLKMEISYTDLSGSRIDVTDLAQGADFFAIVKVSNISGRSNYTDLALTHIIPSGWEIYNERMVAASTAGDDDIATSSKIFTYQDIRDDCVLTYFDLPVGKSKEIHVRIQATYIGEFVFPAIFCEAMYDASARARTTASRVKVTNY